jgi:hypothetical protein
MSQAKLKLTCKRCGVVFVVRPAFKGKVYCSQDCYDRSRCGCIVPLTDEERASGLKRCTKCGDAKDAKNDFYKGKSRCKSCMNSEHCDWDRVQDRNEQRFVVYRYAYRLYQYGISVDEYNALRSAQGGKCAICSASPERLIVDHDHAIAPKMDTKTARQLPLEQKRISVRGLLCAKCNLHHYGDDPVRLRVAADYLERTAVLENRPFYATRHREPIKLPSLRKEGASPCVVTQ